VALKPELVVVAGPNGSGKTTITRRVIQHAWGQGCLYLNPDEIAQHEFGGWDSPEASLQAAQKVALIREECLLSKRSLMFETVFSAPDKIEYIEKARVAGFFIRLFFICTDDPSINQRRIARRRGEGGHDVPGDKVISRYSKSIAQCAIAVKLVDRAYLYDNSIDDADPSLLFRTENGALKKVYRQPVNDWAKPILSKCSGVCDS
jgi:predicted ABC-type ATPase